VLQEVLSEYISKNVFLFSRPLSSGSHKKVWIGLSLCFHVIPDYGDLQKHLGSLINKCF
jgi:hypothetical protein